MLHPTQLRSQIVKAIDTLYEKHFFTIPIFEKVPEIISIFNSDKDLASISTEDLVDFLNKIFSQAPAMQAKDLLSPEVSLAAFQLAFALRQLIYSREDLKLSRQEIAQKISMPVLMLLMRHVKSYPHLNQIEYIINRDEHAYLLYEVNDDILQLYSSTLIESAASNEMLLEQLAAVLHCTKDSDIPTERRQIIDEILEKINRTQAAVAETDFLALSRYKAVEKSQIYNVENRYVKLIESISKTISEHTDFITNVVPHYNSLIYEINAELDEVVLDSISALKNQQIKVKEKKIQHCKDFSANFKVKFNQLNAKIKQVACGVLQKLSEIQEADKLLTQAYESEIHKLPEVGSLEYAINPRIATLSDTLNSQFKKDNEKLENMKNELLQAIQSLDGCQAALSAVKKTEKQFKSELNDVFKAKYEDILPLKLFAYEQEVNKVLAAWHGLNRSMEILPTFSINIEEVEVYEQDFLNIANEAEQRKKEFNTIHTFAHLCNKYPIILADPEKQPEIDEQLEKLKEAKYSLELIREELEKNGEEIRAIFISLRGLAGEFNTVKNYHMRVPSMPGGHQPNLANIYANAILALKEVLAIDSEHLLPELKQESFENISFIKINAVSNLLEKDYKFSQEVIEELEGETDKHALLLARLEGLLKYREALNFAFAREVHNAKSARKILEPHTVVHKLYQDRDNLVKFLSAAYERMASTTTFNIESNLRQNQALTQNIRVVIARIKKIINADELEALPELNAPYESALKNLEDIVPKLGQDHAEFLESFEGIKKAIQGLTKQCEELLPVDDLPIYKIESLQKRLEEIRQQAANYEGDKLTDKVNSFIEAVESRRLVHEKCIKNCEMAVLKKHQEYSEAAAFKLTLALSISSGGGVLACGCVGAAMGVGLGGIGAVPGFLLGCSAGALAVGVCWLLGVTPFLFMAAIKSIPGHKVGSVPPEPATIVDELDPTPTGENNVPLVMPGPTEPLAFVGKGSDTGARSEPIDATVVGSNNFLPTCAVAARQEAGDNAQLVERPVYEITG